MAVVGLPDCNTWKSKVLMVSCAQLSVSSCVCCCQCCCDDSCSVLRASEQTELRKCLSEHPHVYGGTIPLFAVMRMLSNAVVPYF